MSAFSVRNMRLAYHDIVDALVQWRVWYMLGLNEIIHRYRRSTLGPFWLTMSMGVQALVMGILFGYLFQNPIERFLPFVTLSIVLWNFLSTTIMEGSNSLIAASSLIMQVKRPLTMHVLQVLWRNLVIFGHTVVIFFVVALIFGLYPRLTWLLAPLGLMLFVANIAWLSMLTAILSARFRDVPMFVQNAFTVLFWATPVLYMPEQMGGRVAYVLQFNPLFHIIEVLRAPLLQNTPSTLNWFIAVSSALGGWAVTFLLFSRTRSRIPFWV